MNQLCCGPSAELVVMGNSTFLWGHNQLRFVVIHSWNILTKFPTSFPWIAKKWTHTVKFYSVCNNHSVQLLSRVRLFATQRIAACQASLSITSSWNLLKIMFIESVMPSYHLILCVPFFSPLQSFPALGSFPMSQFFASGGQSTGVSASVLPMNIQDWFPLGWTGWISLQIYMHF